MLKDLQEYAAKIRAEADRYDAAHEPVPVDLSARAYVFAYENFNDAGDAEKYLREQVEFGKEHAQKWKIKVMKQKARIIAQAADEGLAILKKGGGNS